MIRRASLWALVPAVFSLAALAPFDAPSFGVSEGASVEKSFRTEGEFALEDASLLFNGEEAPLEQIGMPEDLSLSFGVELGCSDTYESLGDERPLVLLRSFDSARRWYEDQDGDGEDEEPDVVGKVVRFAWNAEEELYEKSFVEEEGDEADLDDLREDLDLRGILPDGDVSEGDSWTTDGITLLELMMPGFDVRASIEGADDEEIPLAVRERVMALLEELAMDCVYAGTVEEDGLTLGKIDLTAAVEEVVEVDPSWLMDEEDQAENPEFSWDHLDLDLDMSFEGSLLWDMEAGRFHSFEGSTEGAATLDFAFAIEGFGLEIEGTMEFSANVE